MPRRCSTSTKTQSVLFPKSWGVVKARKWLRAHGKKAGKVDHKPNHLRFRQFSPTKCKRGNFATIPLGSEGVKAVICCPKR